MWKYRADRPKKWNSKFAGKQAGSIEEGRYVRITIDYIQYYGHRLAWFYVKGEWPEIDTDHENLIKHDNRWDNLRNATKSQNVMNRKRRADNTSGFKGVSKAADRQKWEARIHIKSKKIHLGVFDTKAEAHAAYCAASEKHFGEFARIE